ncbi:MAG: TIGR00266 family protein [Thermoprotei archaeon]
MPKYEIDGYDMQFLSAELASNELFRADGGHLIFKDPTVQIQAKMQGGLLGALKREVTGGSFFLLDLQGPGKVKLASFFPGRVVKVDLNGGAILGESTSFLGCEEGVNYSASLGRLTAGIFGGEGIFLARFEGTGSVFLHGEGNVQELQLESGQQIQVESSHLLAFDANMQYGVSRVGGLKTMVFGGEGLFFVTVTGPGRAWVRSASRWQFMQSVLKAVPSNSGVSLRI